MAWLGKTYPFNFYKFMPFEDCDFPFHSSVVLLVIFITIFLEGVLFFDEFLLNKESETQAMMAKRNHGNL